MTDRYKLEIWKNGCKLIHQRDLGDLYGRAIELATAITDGMGISRDESVYEVDWDAPPPVINGKPERSEWGHAAGWVMQDSIVFDIYLWDTTPELED